MVTDQPGRRPADQRSKRRRRFAAVGLVVACWLTTVPRISTEHSNDRGLIAILSFAVALPLLWRRRAPLLTFGISAAAAGVQWVLTGPLFVDIALLASFYTVAATCSRRATLAAAGVLEFGAAIAVAKYGHGGYAVGALLLTGLVVAAGMLGLNVKVRAAYIAEVEARAARMEYERDQQGQLAAAAERTRIAREMHDIVAHNLSVMIALNDGASFAMKSDPEQAAAAVREASSVGRTALSELQRALGVLRDNTDAAALTPAPTIAELDQLLLPIRRTGLDARLTIEGATAALPLGLQLTIYRLVQESLTNTVKHALRADKIEVTIRTAADHVDVFVIDNGRGRTPADPKQSGHGIIGMHERAAGHGGQVAAGPTANGWVVQARFPYEDLRAATPAPQSGVGASA